MCIDDLKSINIKQLPILRSMHICHAWSNPAEF
jgi:hypothetical protein